MLALLEPKIDWYFKRKREVLYTQSVIFVKDPTKNEPYLIQHELPIEESSFAEESIKNLQKGLPLSVIFVKEPSKAQSPGNLKTKPLIPVAFNWREFSLTNQSYVINKDS